MKLVILLLAASLSWGAETSAPVLGPEKTPADANVLPNWDVPPMSCQSKLYRWNGESFECQQEDRADILMTQRDVNFKALTVCRTQITYLNAVTVMNAKHRPAEDYCATLGKHFDIDSVLCADPLPPAPPGP